MVAIEAILPTGLNHSQKEAVAIASFYVLISEYDDSVIPVISPEDYFCSQDVIENIANFIANHEDFKLAKSLLVAYYAASVKLSIDICPSSGVLILRASYGSN